MLYFKNSDLAYTHHVSVRTVRNWIEAAKQGKLDLDLHTHAGRQYVSNTARNLSTIERMVEDRKKYRPHRAVKVVTPKPEFYRLFNEAQIYDILRNLEIHHEIPRDYSYFDGGAENWNRYANRMATEEVPNNLNSTLKLLRLNGNYIDELISKYNTVNIIDIGVGNALPVKDMITHLLKMKKMGRYIAIDISPEMLVIAEQNISEWFGDSVRFERYNLDINHERFANILADGYVGQDGAKTGNLILLLGGTIQNFRKPEAALNVINSSMGLNDFFIHAQKLDTESSRRYFDFGEGGARIAVPEQNRILIDLLNIEESFYDVEMGFDSKTCERYIRVRLRVALTVEFEFESGKRQVSLNKDDSILLWRAWQNTAREVIEQLNQSDFYPLQISQTDDQEFLLTISCIQKG